MDKPSLYLAGPIYGCTEGEAKDWRSWIAAQLPFMRCISPLRCEPMVGKTYDTHYADPCFGHPKAILAKNFFDLRACDMTLAYFPKPSAIDDLAEIASNLELSGDHSDDERAELLRAIKPLRSIGTIGEVSWAFALRKPAIIVSDDPLIQHHPFTSLQPDWPVLPDLEHAVRLIKGLFTDYTDTSCAPKGGAGGREYDWLLEGRTA